MKPLILILGLALLSGCASKTAEQTQPPVNTTNSAREETSAYLEDPKKDINNFGIEIDYQPLKTVYDDLNKLHHLATFTKNDLCAGDNCTSYRVLTDSLTQTKLYLIKSDYGEYGSSNNQFLFRHDSIMMHRQYSMGPDYATDTSTVYSFMLSELVFEFGVTDVKVRKRSKVQSDFDTYTLADRSFSDSIFTRAEREQKVLKELENLLDIENAPED